MFNIIAMREMHVKTTLIKYRLHTYQNCHHHMLVWIQRNGIPHILLFGMKNNMTTLESSFTISQ